jgi:hypothetical protein
MSKIIRVGEHHITIPQPLSKADVLFYDEKPDRAFWRRDDVIKQFRKIWFDFIPYHTQINKSATLYDQDGILTSLSEDDTNYIIDTFKQEIDRRRNGVFMKNHKEIVWITGDHYFALMYGRMQRHDGMGSYADFREFQAEFFYLIHHVWSQPHILGLIMSKAKKTGITNMLWLYYLNRSTLNQNRNYGYMNIEQGQAAKTFRDYFLYAYNSIIPAMRPAIKQKSEADGTITFGNGFRNSKKAQMMAYDSSDELNSSVFCVPTKDKAFDVAVMSDIAFDEPTKYKQSFENIWSTNKESVKIQSKFNGRAWAFNYTTGDDTDSFRETREIFMASKLKTILPTSQNQTKSGLIAHHIPAIKSWEGAFDVHGRCNEVKAMQENLFEREKVRGDKRKLQAIKRQYANDEKEAWASAGAGSTFDNIRLGDLLSDLEADERDDIETPYQEGRLVWSNSLWETGTIKKRPTGQFCTVNFVPLTQDEKDRGDVGRLRIYYDIPKVHQNIALKQGRDEWGNLIAPMFKYYGGADPTNYAAGHEVLEGSKNAYQIWSIPDESQNTLNKKIVTNVLCMEYFDRQEMPTDAYEDLVKLMVYTGAIMAVEANVPYSATKLMEEGFGHFMIVKYNESSTNSYYTPWKRHMGMAHEMEKKYQLLRRSVNATGNDILESFIRYIKTYFQEPAPGDRDYGKTFKSARAINQLMNFEAENTKIYDLAMCMGWSFFAYEMWYNSLQHEYDEYQDPNNIAAVLRAFAS